MCGSFVLWPRSSPACGPLVVGGPGCPPLRSPILCALGFLACLLFALLCIPMTVHATCVCASGVCTHVRSGDTPEAKRSRGTALLILYTPDVVRSGCAPVGGRQGITRIICTHAWKEPHTVCAPCSVTCLRWLAVLDCWPPRAVDLSGSTSAKQPMWLCGAAHGRPPYTRRSRPSPAALDGPQ